MDLSFLAEMTISEETQMSVKQPEPVFFVASLFITLKKIRQKDVSLKSIPMVARSWLVL